MRERTEATAISSRMKEGLNSCARYRLGLSSNFSFSPKLLPWFLPEEAGVV